MDTKNLNKNKDLDNKDKQITNPTNTKGNLPYMSIAAFAAEMQITLPAARMWGQRGYINIIKIGRLNYVNLVTENEKAKFSHEQYLASHPELDAYFSSTKKNSGNSDA